MGSEDRGLANAGTGADRTVGSVAQPTAWTGVRRIVVDGAVPLLAFWVARQLGGAVAGVLASSASAGAMLVVRRRAGGSAGARGGAAALSAGLVALNVVVGLLARDDAVYLAQGVITTGATGVLFGITAATRRPFAGVLAADFYALSAEIWQQDEFVRTFRVVSLVWAGFELLSAGLRATVLSSTGVYVAVTIALGTIGSITLFWWSVRYANNRLL